MEQQVIAISLSSEVEQLLAENELDLFREIRRRVHDVSVPDRDLQVPPSDIGLKSVELLILASAAAAPLVAIRRNGCRSSGGDAQHAMRL